MTFNFHRFPWFFLAILLLAGCSPISPTISTESQQSAWSYASLRLLDPPDTADPGQDLIAAYVHPAPGSLELRLDFLEIGTEPTADVYIALDTRPGGTRNLSGLDPLQGENSILAWDVLLLLKAGAPPLAVNAENRPVSELITQVSWDTENDFLLVQLDTDALSGLVKRSAFEVFITPPGGRTLVDQSNPFYYQGSPPENRARVGLVFWDALPAKTPAQALRRWDGAHTGPLGQRHGLYHLLKASSETSIPLVLLDLKNPTSLKALDYMGKMDFIRQLEERRLLILKDKISMAIRYVYQPVLINQLDRRGITLATKRTLLEAALSINPKPVLLGGSLPSSLWGESSLSLPAFQYLASHPWIQPLDEYGWLTLPAAPEYANPTGKASFGLPDAAAGWISSLRSRLELLHDGPLSANARQFYLDLTQPTEDQKLRVLRMNYIDHLQRLIAAAEWAQNPTPYSGCDVPSDPDGCIFSSETVFTYYKKTGGRLMLAASLTTQGAVQWIAPASQLALGLSDPTQWRLDNGDLSDPNEIPGAFADPPFLEAIYQAAVEPGKITFTSPDGYIQKTFSIQPQGLQLEYHASTPIHTRVPLVSLPISQYSTANTDMLYPIITIHGADHQTISSWDSFPWMSSPEDPDLDYPPGHYLPFPLKVIQITSPGNFSVHFQLK